LVNDYNNKDKDLEEKNRLLDNLQNKVNYLNDDKKKAEDEKNRNLNRANS